MKIISAKSIVAKLSCVLLFLLVQALPTSAFVAQKSSVSILQHKNQSIRPSAVALSATAPHRLESNVEGPLYVNDRCINCSACAMFAPRSFKKSDTQVAHIVHRQPQTDEEIEQARAALSACPVAAIRVETQAQRSHRNQANLSPQEQVLTKELALSPKLNGRPLPFPRLVSPSNNEKVYFMGHHNEASFGANPYLLYASQLDAWIMIDTPKYSKAAVQALESVTGGRAPDYLILTHVDDTADHQIWKNHYSNNLKRIFHSGDLGQFNWIGDTSLEHVEILLHEITSKESTKNEKKHLLNLQAFDLSGRPLTKEETEDQQVVILHTPGHSPGSISVLFRKTKDHPNPGFLFTGDTYGYRLSSNQMTGFPRYGNDRRLQAQILQALVEDWGSEWSVVAPGHGHVRDYSALLISNAEKNAPILQNKLQQQELTAAVGELIEYAAATRQRW